MFNIWTLQKPTAPEDRLKLAVEVGPACDRSRFKEIGQVIIRELPESTETDGLWKRLVTGVHRYIPEMARDGNAEGISELISGLQFNNLGTGIGWFAKDQHDFRVDPERRLTIRRGLMDNLTSLVAQVGIEPMENPEAGQIGRLANLDGDRLADRIDEYLGYELRSPIGFSNNLGIKRPTGVCDYRTLWAASTAERILTLLEALGIPRADARVVEIGGGVGNLAIQCLRHGIGSYTIVDLPTTRAIQTYVLMSEFPNVGIGFRADASKARLNLILPSAMAGIEANSVHIVVNEDSLPEMTEETGRAYVKEIARVCSGYFLSINHEAAATYADHFHPRVSDLCSGVLRRCLRSPHWMRRGYLEEIFVRPS